MSPGQAIGYGSMIGGSVGAAAVAGAEAGIASAPLGPAFAGPAAQAIGPLPNVAPPAISRAEQAREVAHRHSSHPADPVHKGHQQAGHQQGHSQGQPGNGQPHQGQPQAGHGHAPQQPPVQQPPVPPQGNPPPVPELPQPPQPPQGQGFGSGFDPQANYLSPAPSGPATRARTGARVLRGRSAAIGAAAGAAALLLVVSAYLVLKGNDPSITIATPAADGSTASASVDAPTGSPDTGTATSGDAGNPAPPPDNVVAPPPGQLMVSVQVTGKGGSVRSTDGRIRCPGSCSATYSGTQKVTLVASGPGFLGWASCSQPSGSSCTVGGPGRVSPVARFSTTPTTTTTTRPTTTTPTTTTTTTTTTTPTTTTTTTTSSSSSSSTTTTTTTPPVIGKGQPPPPGVPVPVG
jgi:hypothetical protein